MNTFVEPPYDHAQAVIDRLTNQVGQLVQQLAKTEAARDFLQEVLKANADALGLAYDPVTQTLAPNEPPVEHVTHIPMPSAETLPAVPETAALEDLPPF